MSLADLKLSPAQQRALRDLGRKPPLEQAATRSTYNPTMWALQRHDLVRYEFPRWYITAAGREALRQDGGGQR